MVGKKEWAVVKRGVDGGQKIGEQKVGGQKGKRGWGNGNGQEGLGRGAMPPPPLTPTPPPFLALHRYDIYICLTYPNILVPLEYLGWQCLGFTTKFPHLVSQTCVSRNINNFIWYLLYVQDILDSLLIFLYLQKYNATMLRLKKPHNAKRHIYL